MGSVLIIKNADFSKNGMSFENTINMAVKKGELASFIINPTSVSVSGNTLNYSGGTSVSYIGDGYLSKVRSIDGISTMIFGKQSSVSPIEEIEIIDSNMTLSSWEYMFFCDTNNRLKNLKMLSCAGEVKERTGLYYTFAGLAGVENINVYALDIKNANSLSFAFQRCASLQELDLSSWDSAKISQMTYSFASCTSLREIKFGEKFTASSVINFTRCFYNTRIVNLDIRYFSPSSIANFTEMFRDNPSLKSINLSGFPASATTTIRMFNGCDALEEVVCSSSNYAWIKQQLETDIPSATWVYSGGVIRRG